MFPPCSLPALSHVSGSGFLIPLARDYSSEVHSRSCSSDKVLSTVPAFFSFEPKVSRRSPLKPAFGAAGEGEAVSVS